MEDIMKVLAGDNDEAMKLSEAYDSSWLLRA